jgi:CheY-like chemotaxis protein
MVGGISHDFNNLLSIVTGNLDLAQRRLARGDVNIGMHIDAALEGARKGAVLTGRLLAFARKQNLQPTVTDVNGLIQGMVDMLGTTLGEHIIIDLDLAENLWPCRVDPAQLENAILNLAVNARDAMPAGGRLTLSTLNTDLAAAQGPEISDIEPGQYVTIVVSDSGTGMADDVMERAFEPFFTTKEVGHGTGLGLSQIHGLIKQSGGHVALSSKLGEGTSVRLYLPRHDGPAAASTAGRKKKAASPTPPKTVTVLVVEDEAGVRSVTCGMLADIGYRVLEASCGSEALALIEENPEVSVLLTDVVMPQMLGHELAEKALILRPALKVLYTSGYAYDAAVKAGQLREGANMLPKPFSPDQLAEKIDALLTAEAVDVH